MLQALGLTEPDASKRLRLNCSNRFRHFFLEALSYSKQVYDEAIAVCLLVFEAFKELDEIPLGNIEGEVSS